MTKQSSVTAKLRFSNFKDDVKEKIETIFIIEGQSELLKIDKIRIYKEAQEEATLLLKKHLTYLRHSKIDVTLPLFFICLVKRDNLIYSDIAVVFVDKLPNYTDLSKKKFKSLYKEGKDFEKNYIHPIDNIDLIQEEVKTIVFETKSDMVVSLGPNRVINGIISDEEHPLVRSLEWKICEQNAMDIARCDHFDTDKTTTFSGIGNNYGGLLHELMVRISDSLPKTHKINKSGEILLGQFNRILFSEKYYNNKTRRAINSCSEIRKECAHGRQITEEQLNELSSKVRYLIPILNRIHILKGEEK